MSSQLITLESPRNQIILSSLNNNLELIQGNNNLFLSPGKNSITINQIANKIELNQQNSNIELNQQSNLIQFTISSIINQAVSYVNAGTKIRLDGPDGDSYLIYNPDLSRIEIWKDGVLKGAW